MIRLLFFASLLTLPQAALARGKRKVPFNAVSIGLGVFPLQIKGLENVHLSDGDTYPNSEGRLNLELGNYNTDGPGLMPAFKIGATFGHGMVLGAFDLYAGASDGISGGAVLVGADIRVKQGKLLIGVPLRIGAILGGANLGTAILMPGAQAPVKLEQGDILEGDALNASISGLMASAGILGEFWITKKFAIRGEASIQEGHFSGFSIVAGSDDPDTQEVDERVKIPGTDQAIKKTDGSFDHAEMQPSGGTFGVSGFVGISLKF